MSDKIQAQELVEFTEIIKKFRETNAEVAKLIASMNLLSKEFIDISKIVKESANSNEKLSTATDKVKKSTATLTETEKQLIAQEKLQQKIIEQAAGSYVQLSNKLLLLKNQYKSMSEEQLKRLE